jgi:Zn-dependent peptidase ImmA (M78 family)/DNA-binding XRE family transcriptional regulator
MQRPELGRHDLHRKNTMPITQKDLANRLKTERERLKLTQYEVAERLGLARTSVVQMESGTRAVNSLELDSLARLYQRSVDYFLSETAPDDDPLGLLLRLRDQEGLDENARDGLERCADLCCVITELEETLEQSTTNTPFSYRFDRPETRWEAVNQGIRLAALERKRLDLGSLPVRNLVEIIAQQGVRATKYRFPDNNIAGVFFYSRRTGMVIVANERHPAYRRLFSYAHEYGHLLVDREKMTNISRFSNRDDLIEIRANVFAAHFLMPEEGIRAFLDGVGHGSLTRQVLEVYDGYLDDDEAMTETAIRAQRRSEPGTQTVTMLDTLRLAIHFGTSYEACLYQLLNLKIVPKDRQEDLMAERERAEQLRRNIQTILDMTPEDIEPEARGGLKQSVLNLVIGARLQDRVSGAKAREYLQRVDIDADKLELLCLG